MSSTQRVYGSFAPPAWKASWAWSVATLEVPVNSYVLGAEVSETGLFSVLVPGGDASCRVERTVTSLVAEAVKRRVYGWSASRGMSFWPIIESQGFTVPAGMSAHSRPDSTAEGELALLHQGVFTESKVPLSTRS